MSTSRPELAKSILEALAFTLRGFAEVLSEAEVSIKQVRCVGGGARSPVGVQLKADVLGCPVSTMKEGEAAGFGAALLAGTACGAFSNLEEAMTLAVPQCTFEPDRIRANSYKERYRQYSERIGRGVL